VKKEVIFEGRKIRLVVAQVELPDGRTASREVVEHRGAVVILPLFDDGKVLLENHYRFAVGGYLIEAPAGTLEEREDPAECARRELAEETGLVASEMVHLGDFYSSPGVLTELMHAYLATGLRRGHPRLEEGEVLEPVEVQFEEAVRWALAGKIRDAKTIAALFLAEDRVRGGQGLEL